MWKCCFYGDSRKGGVELDTLYGYLRLKKHGEKVFKIDDNEKDPEVQIYVIVYIVSNLG